jgi:hypothetical protein
VAEVKHTQRVQRTARQQAPAEECKVQALQRRLETVEAKESVGECGCNCDDEG